jgi:hypothetical protein
MLKLDQATGALSMDNVFHDAEERLGSTSRIEIGLTAGRDRVGHTEQSSLAKNQSLRLLRLLFCHWKRKEKTGRGRPPAL